MNREQEIRRIVSNISSRNTNKDFCRGFINCRDRVLSEIKELGLAEEIVMPWEFHQWYEGFVNRWSTTSFSAKSVAIMNINKIGHGFALEDYNGNRVETDPVGNYADLRDYIYENKELCTRAILDGFKTTTEPLFFMPIPFSNYGFYYKTSTGNTSISNTKESHPSYKFTREELTEYFPGLEHKATEVEK